MHKEALLKTGVAYRDDLTILRAIAVLAVVFFHGGFAWASGGYIGVDIFFVLSGYLITESIKSNIEKNRFSLLSFYLRRALRILPAAITVIVITGLVGSKILFPEETIELFESIRSSLYLQSNIWASKSVNYFGIGIEFKPLIHYWSLSIELQFYIVFPAIIAILFSKGYKTLLNIVIFTIFTASIIYAFLYIDDDPNKGYFSTLMRAWEFSLGVLLSLYRSKFIRFNERVHAILSIVGYLLIFSAIFLFDAHSKFPGPLALVPCIGVSLAIIFGGKKIFNVKTVLIKPLIFIGNISFSLYLVHQPIMAFYRTLLGREFVVSEVYGSILLSTFIAALLYACIEKPFRMKTVDLKSVSAITLVFTIGVITYYVSSFYANKSIEDYPVSSQVKAYLQYRYDNNPRVSECRVDNRIIEPEKACLYGNARSPKVALWGDSHADQLVYPLYQAIDGYGHSVLEFAIAGCPPITNVRSPSGIRKCTENANVILNYLTSNKDIHHVVLHAYWTGYFDDELILSSQDPVESFRDVLVALLDAGKKVHIIYPVPKMKVNPPLYLARRALFQSNTNNSIPSITLDDFKTQSSLASKFLQESTSGLNVNHIHIGDFLVVEPEKMTYVAADDGKVFYRDDNHLSVTGGKLVSGLIADKMFENGIQQ